MMCGQKLKARGFSLIELVIVVVIIGIIAAIAIPRMSRGAAGAGDSALTSNLAMMRKALELYSAEHGNTFPDDTKMPDALLKCSDATGTISTATPPDKATTAFPFGPYLRSIPTLNVGSLAHSNAMAFTNTKAGGWFYDKTIGEIKANLDPAATNAADKDSTGKAYFSY